jgi:hypothetical protein
MRVTPVPHGLEDLLSKSLLPRSTDTLHMSDIYGALYRELEPARYGRTDPPDPLKLEAGIALETVLERAIAERLIGSGRPGELTTPEGIVYSPDFIIFNGVTRLTEFKLTWLSSREWPREAGNSFPPKASKYLTQVKLYCRAIGTDEARLVAFFVNGDYRRNGPELLAWDVSFSKRELEEEWDMCMAFARQKGLLA